jgi:hypothetical protein
MLEFSSKRIMEWQKIVNHVNFELHTLSFQVATRTAANSRQQGQRDTGIS